ncbi:Cysteine protease ATG4, partial [Bienertia sinuspersici]
SRYTIIILDDAKTLWDSLSDRYSLGNGPRILEIKHAIADCKQRDSKKFGFVVSALLMSDLLPTMNAAYAEIVADDRKQSISEECSHFKKFGHDRKHCYDLHGFLDRGHGVVVILLVKTRVVLLVSLAIMLVEAMSKSLILIMGVYL